jgi:hypothetical protein
VDKDLSGVLGEVEFRELLRRLGVVEEGAEEDYLLS